MGLLPSPSRKLSAVTGDVGANPLSTDGYLHKQASTCAIVMGWTVMYMMGASVVMAMLHKQGLLCMLASTWILIPQHLSHSNRPADRNRIILIMSQDK